jgi:hypothetical protein
LQQTPGHPPVGTMWVLPEADAKKADLKKVEIVGIGSG